MNKKATKGKTTTKKNAKRKKMKKRSKQWIILLLRLRRHLPRPAKTRRRLARQAPAQNKEAHIKKLGCKTSLQELQRQPPRKPPEKRKHHKQKQKKKATLC